VSIRDALVRRVRWRASAEGGRLAPDNEENPMKYMVMHYSNEANEADAPPTPEHIAAVGQYIGEAAQAGILLAAEGVRASSHGARVTVENGRVTVTDGPFAEAKELIAGFAILDVGTKEEAVEHAKRFASIIGAERVDVRLVAEH
jgi:hypothetical protein